MSNFVNLLDIVYPVGSIYITTNDISPVDSVGGTWTQIEDGACLAAYTDTSGYTGSKTISINQMPKHNHQLTDIMGCGWNSTNATGDKLIYGNMKAGRGIHEFGTTVMQGKGEDYIPYSYACRVWVRTA